MEQKIGRVDVLIIITIIAILSVAAVFGLPWERVTWGRVKQLPGDTITVVGEAKTAVTNQKAMFSAGVNVVSDNKDNAIAEVNKKTDAIIDAVKTFGVPADDVKTQNLNVFQGEETYYEDGRQKARPGQWRVNNTIEITLRSVKRASELAEILTKSGANNIYGPNFSLDDTGEAEKGLLEDALKNAKEKATVLATATGKKLGAVVNIVEGYQGSPQVYRMEGGGGGGIEAGTATVTKTVTVTYQLK